MAAVNPRLADLSDDDRLVLESWLVEFDQRWDDGVLADRAEQIPPGSSWRLPALAEMVKIDLERQWQRGRQVSLESYLKAFPELGSPADVSADLIQAEYEVRCQFGAPATLEDYLRRFPHQAGELARLIAQGGSSLSRRSSPGVPKPGENVPELPEQFGRYRIIKRLGQGGMGSVHLAEDTQLQRRVALKVASYGSQDGSEARNRLLAEARAAATLDHPYLCPVHDVGEIDGRLYLTMAYIDGQSLADLTRGKFLLPRPAAALVRKLALALQEAHVKGVIHRDLKPSNIMIKSTASRREPVIVDFGLARRDDAGEARLTRTGQIMGTLEYMAPEQLRGELKEIGPACDIYALGVILYELLTGRRPFEASGLAVVGQILTQEPLRPSTFRPDLDPRLEATCLKAMAKKREDRFATMNDLAAALNDFVRGAAKTPEAGEGDGTEMRRALDGEDRGNRNLHLAETGVQTGTVPAPKSGKTGGRRNVVRIAVASLALATLLAGIVYRIATDYGQLVIDTDDPDVEVEVTQGGKAVKLIDTKTQQTVELRPGEYRLELKGDAGGLRLSPGRVTITRNGREIATIRREGLSRTASVPIPGNATGPDPLDDRLAIKPTEPETATVGREELAKAPSVPPPGNAAGPNPASDGLAIKPPEPETATVGREGLGKTPMVPPPGNAAVPGPNPAGDVVAIKPPPGMRPETRVNPPLPGWQGGALGFGPACVGIDSQGNFAVLWVTDLNVHQFGQYYVSLFDSAGHPLRDPISVGPPGSRYAELAVGDQGDFVVAWDAGSNTMSDVYAQWWFDPAGDPIRQQRPVNDALIGDQHVSTVGMCPTGGFVIIWGSEPDAAVPGALAFAKRFSSMGNPQRPEFLVVPRDETDASGHGLAFDEKGNFVITWINGGLGERRGLRARRFDANGTPRGNALTLNHRLPPVKQRTWARSIAMNAAGDFVVVWDDNSRAGDDWNVFAQRFDAQGNPQGEDFQVNTHAIADQSMPSVAMDAKGNLLIVYRSFGEDGSDFGIYGQRYDTGGSKIGSNFLVNTTTQGPQNYPRVAMNRYGDFVIVWCGNGPGDPDGVFFRYHDEPAKRPKRPGRR